MSERAITRIVSLFVGLAALPLQAGGDPTLIEVNGTPFTKQGWDADERDEFYFTSQGSQLIPSAWMKALERADSTELFLDATDGLQRFGYLSNPAGPTKRNREGLPIGFVKDSPSKSGRDCEFLGMTCASCHTGRIRNGAKELFIDGAPTSANFEEMLRALRDAIAATAQDPSKLTRFTAKIPPEERRGEEPTAGLCLDDREEKSLEAALRGKADYFGMLLDPDGDPLTSAGWGPARIDAVGLIINQIFLHLEQPEKMGPVNAPVSYPFIWDVHQHNQVQWNGVSQFPLVRNTVEVMGVFADFGPDLKGIPGFKNYDSTVRVGGLRTLEDRVKTLRSPAWPAAFFGRPIDEALRAKGEVIFKIECASCHGPDVPRDEPIPDIKAVMTTLDRNDRNAIGTDPAAATNFASAPGDDVFLDCTRGPAIGPPMEDELGEVTPNVLGGKVIFFLRNLPEILRVRLSLPKSDPNRCAYKGRPLDGIWATAPYLHNGSVPNLDELLKPADCTRHFPEECRVKKFCVSKVQTLDVENIGVPIPPPGQDPVCGEGELLFDTTKPGNLNTGHEYGEFSKEEREALVEYQRSL